MGGGAPGGPCPMSSSPARLAGGGRSRAPKPTWNLRLSGKGRPKQEAPTPPHPVWRLESPPPLGPALLTAHGSAQESDAMSGRREAPISGMAPTSHANLGERKPSRHCAGSQARARGPERSGGQARGLLRSASCVEKAEALRGSAPRPGLHPGRWSGAPGLSGGGGWPRAKASQQRHLVAA